MRWARSFLEATQNPDMGFLYVGVELCVERVLDYFLATENMDLLVQQLNALDKWLRTVPPVRRLVEGFQHKVAEKVASMMGNAT